MTTAAAPGLRRVEHVMGMPVVVEVRDDGARADDLDRLFDWLRFVDATFTTYDEASEICRLERGELALGDTHPDVREVLRRCELLRDETGGYFDAHATGRLDPSGFVKGWSVDRAGWLLDAAGIRNYCINAGGDIRARGAALPEREVYLCGPPAMAGALKKTLRRAGVPRKHLHTERFAL